MRTKICKYGNFQATLKSVNDKVVYECSSDIFKPVYRVFPSLSQCKKTINFKQLDKVFKEMEHYSKEVLSIFDGLKGLDITIEDNQLIEKRSVGVIEIGYTSLCGFGLVRLKNIDTQEVKVIDQDMLLQQFLGNAWCYWTFLVDDVYDFIEGD